MFLRQLFDPESSTYSYLLADEQTGKAVLIDPVLEQVDRDLTLISELGFSLEYTLETHVHADHVTGAGVIRERVGSQSIMSKVDGASCADILVDDGEVVCFGRYGLEARATPGHTAGCTSWVTLDQKAIFTGDALLIRSCGRTDFQGGDSRRLFHSIHDHIFSLPDDTTVYPAHDYTGRTCSTVGEEKRLNPRLGGGRSIDEFVVIMDGLNLPQPKRMDEVLPANLDCGIIHLETARTQKTRPVED
ncbi:MAG TPA: MBL fold metallo-hydrolase [Myxococcales bacterium]|nr:MBL fold metallo-hydrolase [Myxococcales bacterium]